MVSAEEFFNSGSGLVTLCGSTKYFTQYMEAARQLAFNNWIVFTCGSFGHSYHKDADPIGTPETFEDVKKLHFLKIQMSNAIVVVHDMTEVYIGNSTKAEIKYAEYLSLPIFYFDGVNFRGKTEDQPSDFLESDKISLQMYAADHDLGF
jgi:hypothetical protein